MNIMSMLTDKLKEVGQIVQRQTKKISDRADALIAKEVEIEKRTEEAFGSHEGILSEASKGLDDLERQLALVSNNPSPLPESGSSMKSEQPEKKNNA